MVRQREREYKLMVGDINLPKNKNTIDYIYNELQICKNMEVFGINGDEPNSCNGCSNRHQTEEDNVKPMP